jgi:hypothetical protein
MAAATAAYGVYALAEPRHLGRALHDEPADQAAYDPWSRAFGVRDLAVSAVVLFGGARAVRTATATRIAFDVTDGTVLALRAPDSGTRAKVLGVTLGWAALNGAALALDSRRA